MKAKPDINAFLEGGAADKASAADLKSKPAGKGAAVAAPQEEPRKQKLARLPVSLLNALKQRALDISTQTGRRVSEEDLIIEALQKFLYS